MTPWGSVRSLTRIFSKSRNSKVAPAVDFGEFCSCAQGTQQPALSGVSEYHTHYSVRSVPYRTPHPNMRVSVIYSATWMCTALQKTPTGQCS